MNNPNTIFTTIGASNHSQKEREDNDFYATDPRALELLLEREQFDPLIWECACGKGHLSEVLRKHGYIVYSTDLVDRGYGVGGTDFLSTQTPFCGDIITNPPYKMAQEFVEHALSLISEGNRVAMFLKLTFLEGKNRRKLFEIAPPATSMFRPAVCNALWAAILKSTSKEPDQRLPTHGSFGKRAFPANP